MVELRRRKRARSWLRGGMRMTASLCETSPPPSSNQSTTRSLGSDDALTKTSQCARLAGKTEFALSAALQVSLAPQPNEYPAIHIGARVVHREPANQRTSDR